MKKIYRGDKKSNPRRFSAYNKNRTNSRPEGRSFESGAIFHKSENVRDAKPEHWDRKRREMNRVECDRCHKSCEVPFVPSGNKPVLCSDCFRRKGHFDRDNNKTKVDSVSQEVLQEINEKLDEIMRALHIR